MESTTEGNAREAKLPAVVARHERLVRRTVLVSALTLASRVMGYARESVMAALFGDKSAINDAFITAWSVPNLFRRLLGEGALSTSLQTTLTEVDHDHGEAAGRALFLRTAHVTSWILLAVAVALMAFAALAPDTVPGIGWSDHWAFREFGYPAIMLTDTAPFRYPHYHKPSDTPDKVDYLRLARITKGVERVVRDIAR